LVGWGGQQASGGIIRPEAHDGRPQNRLAGGRRARPMQQEAEAAVQTVEMFIEDWQQAPVEPSDLAKLGEYFGVEVGANPETRDPNQLIQHRSRGLNQSCTLGLRHHAKKTSDGQP
jgi:hypothetical protein